MRALWKGSLTFGLVSVPCKLYKGVDDAGTSFHLIHPECGSRVKRPNYCPTCQRLLEAQEVKKGFEYAAGSHIVLDDADMEALPLKSARTIEIEGFTQQDIDPRALDTHYVLSPDKGGEKPFTLLYRVMEKLRARAIGKVSFREREHLCLISAYQGLLLVQTLFYAEELRPLDEVRPGQVMVSEKELQLAEAIVGEMLGVFCHESYRDEYQEALEKLVLAKLEGRTVAPVATAAGPSDLMEALEKSVEALKGAR